jgi:integrase
MNQTLKLTDEAIVQAQAPEKGSIFLWDEGTRGGSFGVRVFAGGQKTYVVRYRLGTGRGAPEKLRKLEPWSKGRLKEIRARAGAVLLAARQGEDILEEHYRGEGGATVESYGREWLTGTVREASLTPKTVKLYTFLLERRLVPAMGKKLVADVDERDVRAFKRKWSTAKMVSNKAVRLLRQILDASEKDGLRPRHSNPCTSEMLYPEEKSAGIYLTVEEQGRLAAVLQNLSEQQRERKLLELILLLAFTSCRPIEIATLRVEQFDRERKVLVLQRTSKSKQTKTKKQRLVALNSVALALIERLCEGKMSGPVFEIAAGRYDWYQNWVERQWRELRVTAQLPDGVRVYDLRHNFPSWAVMLGENLSLVQHMQGHADLKTTEKYVHLAVDPVREASERVAVKLAEQFAVAMPVN